MSESKTYIFGENQNGGSNGMLGLLAPLLQKQGVDPNVLLAMKGNNGFTPQPMETVVDVKVKLNDEEVDFKQLPANGQIANDKNLVVSDNKEAMSAEVDTMLRQSKAILESVDYHKKVVDSCEGMLLQLNPQIAKEREQTEKISKLEGKVSGMAIRRCASGQ